MLTGSFVPTPSHSRSLDANGGKLPGLLGGGISSRNLLFKSMRSFSFEELVDRLCVLVWCTSPSSHRCRRTRRVPRGILLYPHSGTRISTPQRIRIEQQVESIRAIIVRPHTSLLFPFPIALSIMGFPPLIKHPRMPPSIPLVRHSSICLTLRNTLVGFDAARSAERRCGRCKWTCVFGVEGSVLVVEVVL
jgi:hypothetical protein